MVTYLNTAAAESKYKPLDVSATAFKLRYGYVARDPQLYRTAMFETLVIMGGASPAEAERIAVGIVNEINKGNADGLEPLLLA
jgi:hypothetical protein